MKCRFCEWEAVNPVFYDVLNRRTEDAACRTCLEAAQCRFYKPKPPIQDEIDSAIEKACTKWNDHPWDECGEWDV